MAVLGLAPAWGPSVRKRCSAQPGSAELRCSTSRARPTSSIPQDRDRCLGGVQAIRKGGILRVLRRVAFWRNLLRACDRLTALRFSGARFAFSSLHFAARSRALTAPTY